VSRAIGGAAPDLLGDRRQKVREPSESHTGWLDPGLLYSGFSLLCLGGTCLGWSYRKSVNLGPFRVNLSKSGVGYSIGGRGFRTGVRGDGRRYTSVSIPGTGLRYTKTAGRASAGPGAGGSRGTGCLVAIPAGAGILVLAHQAWKALT